MCSREPVSSIEHPTAGSRAAPAAPAAPAWRKRRRFMRMRARRLADVLWLPAKCVRLRAPIFNALVFVPITLVMHRVAISLILFALAPSAAAAQTSYPLGRLVPPEYAQAPDTVPRGPVGDYPEDWVKCGSGHRPEAQVYPRELDQRAVDPAAPNPLVGTKWFVD